METSKNKDELVKLNEDKELSELLDSALQDFTTATSTSSKESQKVAANTVDTKDETEWSDEFIRQAAEQFESNIANILKNVGGTDVTSEQIQHSLQRMAEAAQQVSTNNVEPVSDADFATSISQALKGLSEGTENLQNPFSEQDLMSMFGQQSGDANAFVPFMQGMMQSLLSKDVLYPSLKDILEKFPTWLEANGGSLSSDERNKYEKQMELMKQVCEQLEKEQETDTPDKKKAQFDKVLALMQKLQDYGQPPAELAGDLGIGMPFDENGKPDMQQCNIM